MARVLLIDDERDFLSCTARLLRFHGHVVFTADTLHSARRALRACESDAVVLDLMLPDGNGLELLDDIPKAPRRIERVIVITGQAPIKTRIESLSGPGVSYLTKPIDYPALLSLLDGLGESDDAASESSITHHFELLIGESPPMQRLYAQIDRIAGLTSPVLLLGETGTGKELVAEAIHRESRRSGRFLPVNCGSLSRELAASELFGHERGSFTGATRRHAGFFERADKGTLLLDEVTEMPPEMQPHLLRVLETGRVLPVGSEQEITVDARIVAATNRVHDGQSRNEGLRQDLYYRLGVFPVTLPPLRERIEDLPLLLDHFLGELSHEHGMHQRLSGASMRMLAAYRWPGNVRELRHVLHRAYILADSDEGELELVPEHFEGPFAAELEHEEPCGLEVGRSIRDMERELILRTLDHFDGDKRAAAQVLGVSLNTLYNRLQRYEQEKPS